MVTTGIKGLNFRQYFFIINSSRIIIDKNIMSVNQL
jgi:hypothetical protein